MKFLDGLLSDSQLQSIVDYLSNVPVPQAPAATSNLYDLYCASCHGAGGVGGPDGSVLGESSGDISEAIREVSAMRSLAFLTSSQIREIAQYLNQGGEDEENRREEGILALLPLQRDSGSIPMSESYDLNCASCHGVDGLGGTKDAPIVNASAKAIDNALQQEPDMKFLTDSVTATDVKRISLYLNRQKSGGTGTLNWVMLLGAGAWLALRRRRK